MLGKNTFLEEYVEVKEENIQISEEITEDLIIEEDPEIKINVEKIIEDPSIHKEEIIEEFVNVLNEVKLDDFNVQAPIILVGDIETKFIDFIGVEICDLIIDAYLVNIVNCMKIVGEKS